MVIYDMRNEYSESLCKGQSMMIVMNYMAALYRVLSWTATAIYTWPEGDCFILQVTRTELSAPLPARLGYEVYNTTNSCYLWHRDILLARKHSNEWPLKTSQFYM